MPIIFFFDRSFVEAVQVVTSHMWTTNAHRCILQDLVWWQYVLN